MTGCVGIFWFVPAAAGASQILAHATPLTKADRYGDAISHEGHADLWDRLKTKGATRLRRDGYPLTPAFSEYDEWPRGRVVFDTRSDLFVIFADRRLQRPPFLLSICEAFRLVLRDAVVRSDEHYSRSNAVGLPVLLSPSPSDLDL